MNPLDYLHGNNMVQPCYIFGPTLSDKAKPRLNIVLIIESREVWSRFIWLNHQPLNPVAKNFSNQLILFLPDFPLLRCVSMIIFYILFSVKTHFELLMLGLTALFLILLGNLIKISILEQHFLGKVSNCLIGVAYKRRHNLTKLVMII